MRHESQKKSMRLVLTGPGQLGRIHVDTEAFFDFSFWLAEELQDLVSQWSGFRPSRYPAGRHASGHPHPPLDSLDQR